MMVFRAVRLMLVELGLVLYMKVRVGFGLGMKVTGRSSLMSGGFWYKDFFALVFISNFGMGNTGRWYST